VSPLQPTEFEHLAVLAAREVEGLRLELLGGRPAFRPMADGVHSTLTTWLARQCWQQKPEWGLHIGLGLKVGADREGRAVPDGVLLPVGHLLGTGYWAEPDGVLLTAEVTSGGDEEADRRDRIDKPRAYAESAIPVYLLIDRDSREVVVHDRPEDGVYAQRLSVPFGKTVALPEPVGIELDTQQLLSWAVGEGER
jgi:Uma2 family endonuclease